MERQFWIRTLALGFLASVLLLVGGNFYLSRMQQSLWEQSVSNVLEVTAQGAKTFEVYVDQGLAMLEGRAANFAEYSSADTSVIGAKLDLYEEGDPSFTAIDLTHGVIYFNSLEHTDLSPEQVEKYLALPPYGFLEPYLSEYTGQRMVGCYERFVFADGAQGMVRKSVLISEATEQFSLSFYDGAGFSYVVNAQGDIVLRSGFEAGNRTFLNVFDVIALDKNTPEDVSAFRAGMSGGKRGVMRLSFNSADHIFAFVPLDAVDGWYLISVVPDHVIMEHADRILRASQLLIGVILMAGLILISFILLTVQHRRQVRATETEVLYREQLFNLLAHNTNDVFIMLAADARTVEYISPNVERVTGVPMETAAGDLHSLQSILHGDGREFDFSSLLPIPMDDSISFEGSCLHMGTGERRWFMESIYHTTIQSVERYIVVLADRTEDRKKEAALTDALEIAKVANDAKSAFLSNMSHDIRTPMNAIVGLSALLQRDADDPDKVREHTRRITASSQHLLSLINDVLDMSKIESGKTTLHIDRFNLAELVGEVGSIILPQARAKKQTFDISVLDLRNEDLWGDRLRITQILINILSNAVKYTPVGGRITMTVRQLNRADRDIVRIRFTVADTGIGMSEEYQQMIFQPFTRESRAVVHEIQGTGLGMPITKSLVDLMGGAITVNSRLGQGSVFTVDLDLRVPEREEDQGFWTEHGIASALVVDDDADVCTGILGAMADTGVAVQFALDGPTAITMVQSAHQAGKDFDLILLDWKMPGMDALEIARQIRARISARIPIMILTSYEYEEIRNEGMAAGIDGFLSKPFFLSNFKEVLRAVRQGQGLPPAHTGTGALSGRRFLCAEDNELSAEILTELLAMEGAECQVFPNGKEAVEHFAASDPGAYDAILLDIQMPVMNGIEAARAIRELDHPTASAVPIVAMTANAFADDVRDCLEAGMDAHIAKPLDLSRLSEVLVKLWSSRP